MNDEIRNRFRGRFLETANRRVARAVEHMEADAGIVRAELHSLTGEASLLGFAIIARLSRSGEAAAKSWLEASDEASRDECATLLHDLEARLAELRR